MVARVGIEPTTRGFSIARRARFGARKPKKRTVSRRPGGTQSAPRPRKSVIPVSSETDVVCHRRPEVPVCEQKDSEVTTSDRGRLHFRPVRRVEGSAISLNHLFSGVMLPQSMQLTSAASRAYHENSASHQLLGKQG